jgi:hypothetical protein
MKAGLLNLKNLAQVFTLLIGALLLSPLQAKAQNPDNNGCQQCNDQFQACMQSASTKADKDACHTQRDTCRATCKSGATPTPTPTPTPTATLTPTPTSTPTPTCHTANLTLSCNNVFGLGGPGASAQTQVVNSMTGTPTSTCPPLSCSGSSSQTVSCATNGGNDVAFGIQVIGVANPCVGQFGIPGTTTCGGPGAPSATLTATCAN